MRDGVAPPGIAGLWVQVLGPLRVWRDGVELSLGHAKQRAVLGVLALHAGETVARDQIVETVWEGRQPASAVNLVHTYVARLRRVLEPDRPQRSRAGVLIADRTGYRLWVGEDQADLLRFRGLAAAARRAREDGDDPRALDLGRAALDLWRGECVADLPGSLRAHPVAVATERQRVASAVHAAAVALRLDRADAVLPHLHALAAADPLDELVASWLMLALAAVGRQADALAVHEGIRTRLREDLGIDPGPELRDAHRRVPRQEVGAADPGPGAAPGPGAPARGPVPRQLPPDVAAFTGREAELARLRRLLEEGGTGQGPVAIWGIDGIGGIGKSALAVHLAHQLRERFPDGQLYANLQGATAGIDPLSPREVLGRFLRALGVEGEVPAEVEEAAALFRSLAAERRLLLLLDNARDAAQVRPLLPAGPGCAVLITSRRRLAALEAAVHLHLEVMEPAEAVTLLARLAGAERVAAEPAEAARLARLCGHLPLALRIAGARLAARPRWRLRTLVERLDDERRRLDELAAGELAVRASFEVSWRALAASADPVERAAPRVFALLGLLDLPDVSLAVAARLLDQPEHAVEPVLERLVDAQLLSASSAGRYGMHDLLRLFAREQATAVAAGDERQAALERVWRCYVGSAWRAQALLHPAHRRGAAAPEDLAAALPLADRAAALAWLEEERANLPAAARQAAATPATSTVTVQLARASFCFYELRSDGRDWQSMCQLALEAARRGGDRGAEARALSDLGVVHERWHQDQAALDCYQRSLAIRRELGDRDGEAVTLHNLAGLHEAKGELAAALDCAERAVAIFQDLGNRHGEAAALGSLGIVHNRSGRPDLALDCHQRALAIKRDSGDRRGEGMTQHNIGSAQLNRGRVAAAVDRFRRALDIYREVGDRYAEVVVLIELAQAYQRDGRPALAVECCEQALHHARALNARIEQARALRALGDALAALDRSDRAAACRAQALAIFEELGAGADADALRARLSGGRGGPSASASA